MSKTEAELPSSYLAARDKADAAADAECDAREAMGDETNLDAEVSQKWLKAKADSDAAQATFAKHVQALPGSLVE